MIKQNKTAQNIAREFNLSYQIAHFDTRTYPIYYGENLLSICGEILKKYSLKGNVLIISHPELKEFFGKEIEKSLKKEGYQFVWANFSKGEKNKNLETVSKLYTLAAQAKIDKSSAVIALGGGVVQDVANYFSATYLRGVPFIQIPTTVLSQADVGIGGCAIDHPLGKSLIGQFYQPRFVLMDSCLLKTLPKEELSYGISEIINKVMCLAGYEVDKIEYDVQEMKEGNWKKLEKYIKLSNKVKIQIIEKDETGREGTRLMLDWGHTLTHALERTLNYSISHGKALGIGMYYAALLSSHLGHLKQKDVEKLARVIKNANLPTHISSDISLDKLIHSMALDQKVKEGKKRFILLKKFGKPFMSDFISDEIIRERLSSIQK